MIFKNRRQEVERVVESEIVPNRHVFVSSFGQEIKEKVQKYSQIRYCSSTNTYFNNNNILTTKMNFDKLLEGGGACG